LSFLREKCGLKGAIPGFAVEHHGEFFGQWRRSIETGDLVPPFHVTHVDAHADLGIGETGHIYLLSELLAKPPEERWFPMEGEGGLTDGSFLAFAIGCRWISDLLYVYSPGGGSDVHPYLMEGKDLNAPNIRLPRVTSQELQRFHGGRKPTLPASQLEPPVPFSKVRCSDFQAEHAFDMICIARSPAYTPRDADLIFDDVRREFVDESAFDGSKPGSADAEDSSE
jgi:hypothetical protein